MDNNVLARLAAGDSKIWKFIYKEYRPEFITQVVQKYDVTLEEAEDAFQVAAIKLMQKAQSGELACIKKSLRSLVYVCFRNQLLDDCKNKDDLLVEAEIDEIPDRAVFNADLCDKDMLIIREEMIMKILPSLPARYRKLYGLLACGKYDKDTIAKKLKLKNAQAVRKMKHDMIKEIRRLMAVHPNSLPSQL
jgi:RNA polymerase sigma factor (sigma-70 family)